MQTILNKLLENGTIVLAFLGLLAYFIKRLFDLKSKKTEIRYSLFHQEKLKHMIEFQAAYFALEKDLSNYAKDIIKNEQIDIIEFKEQLRAKFKRFNSGHETVRFFIRDIEKPAFDRMSKNLSHFYEELYDIVNSRSILTSLEMAKRIEDLDMYKHITLKKGSSQVFEFIYSNYRKEFEMDKSKNILEK